MENLNWLSLIIATLTPMIIGFVYYHKAVFGKAWMSSIGMTEEKAASGNMGKIMGISLVMSFLIAFFLLQWNNGPGQEGTFDSFGHGAAHGAILSIFVVIPVFITNGLFEQKSWSNMLINAGYWLITLVIMGGLVDSMNHFPNAL